MGVSAVFPGRVAERWCPLSIPDAVWSVRGQSPLWEALLSISRIWPLTLRFVEKSLPSARYSATAISTDVAMAREAERRGMDLSKSPWLGTRSDKGVWCETYESRFL